MRIVGLLSMTALILTGLPPVPIGLAPANAQSAERTRRIAPPGGDPDARCAPFLQAGGDYDDASNGYARRGNTLVLTNGRRNTPSAPPPPRRHPRRFNMRRPRRGTKVSRSPARASGSPI